MTGVELQLRYQPSDRTLINAHYAYTDVDSGYVFTYDPVLSTNDHNDRVPRHKAGLLVHQKIAGGLSGSINFYHMTDANWRDGNDVDQFVRTDAVLGYDFRIGKSSGNLSLIAQNLGDDYEEHARNNVFDTRYFLKLTMDFN